MASTDSLPAQATPTLAGLPAAATLGGRWQALPGRLQAMAAIGLAAVLAVVVVLWLQTREGEWRVLFPGLSERDGGQIIERLSQMNVPYKFSEGGATLMVPAARVHELRMKLAAAGLPAHGAGSGRSGPGGPTAGYELLDKSPFGQTHGQERMNVQRATEGELTRTIQSLGSVQSARVHLALPQQNGFFREQQKPSASVVLNLHPGRVLERSQIAGIVHLVSSSVAELNPKAVSVIDGNGSLLSGQEEGAAEGLDSQQLQYRNELETGHQRRILALLEPVVGRDNLRVSVAADLDFSQVMQTAEAWRPNQGFEARPAIREQRSEHSSQPVGGYTAGGIPGAASNLPVPTTAAPASQPASPPASAPLSGPVQALHTARTGLVAAGQSPATRKEEATRYELDKTVTVTRSAVGSVKRLTAAVVVNHRATTDAKGRAVATPLSQTELDELTALVQQSIGFTASRGDQVKVVNAPFRAAPAPAAPVAEPGLLGLGQWLTPDQLRAWAAPMGLALVALFAVFGLLRPVAKALAPNRNGHLNLGLGYGGTGQHLNATVGGHGALGGLEPSLQAGPTPALPSASPRIDAARQLARQNPAAVANIVRGWVNGERV